jgi:hypothetical protein
VTIEVISNVLTQKSNHYIGVFLLVQASQSSLQSEIFLAQIIKVAATSSLKTVGLVQTKSSW